MVNGDLTFLLAIEGTKYLFSAMQNSFLLQNIAAAHSSLQCFCERRTTGNYKARMLYESRMASSIAARPQVLKSSLFHAIFKTE